MSATPRGVSARQLEQRFGLTKTIAAWLSSRGLESDAAVADFLEPKLSALTPPEAMVDRAPAAERIARAISARRRIVVFGDYDCDGITSTAILTEAIRELGGDAVPLLASRFDGGYGVSAPAADKIVALAPDLLVTCDCGSSDHRSLSSLRERGIDAVVIDHHLVPEEPLPAIAFLNPHRPECGFPYKGLASCGLALSVVAALRKQLGVDLDVRRWLDLVAVGTIADVAPLDGDNRRLVRAGLAALARGARPGLRALLEQLRVSVAGPLSARDVAFRIAPQLNAPGRMGDPMLALRLLMAKDEQEAAGLAFELQQRTEERRAVQERMLEEAKALIDAEGQGEHAAIVLGQRGWNHGVVGIVAGRLADDLARPVAVVGFEGDVGRGSIRGPAGSRLFDALQAASQHVSRFGGHQAAAGFELEWSSLPAFREAFCAAIAASPREAQAPSAPVCVWDPSDLPARVLEDLDRLEPCGLDNPRPSLELRGQLLDTREVGNGHLKLRLAVGAWQIEGFAPNLAASVLGTVGAVSIFGDLRRNTFRGVTQPELFVERIERRS